MSTALVYKMVSDAALRAKGLVKRRGKWYSSRALRKRYPRKKWRRGAGHFVIDRRIPMVSVYSTAGSTLPNIITNNPNVFKIGLPVAAATGLTGYYDVPFALELHLNDLQDFGDIVNICDKYKLLKATIVCQAQVKSAGTPQVSSYIQYVHDWDDSDFPTVNFMNTKMGLINKGLNSNGQVIIKAYPKVSQQVYNSATSTAYAPASKSIYLDTSYAAVPHYCLKGVIRNVLGTPTATETGAWTMDIKLTVACKDLQ